MAITPEHAFGLLDFYQRHEVELFFGERILGGEAATCDALISHLWSENQSISIKLFSDDGSRSWDRLISLARAEFLLVQVGDPDSEEFSPFHSVLVIRFPDGRTLFLAEQQSISHEDGS